MALHVIVHSPACSTAHYAGHQTLQPPMSRKRYLPAQVQVSDTIQDAGHYQALVPKLGPTPGCSFVSGALGAGGGVGVSSDIGCPGCKLAAGAKPGSVAGSGAGAGTGAGLGVLH